MIVLTFILLALPYFFTYIPKPGMKTFHFEMKCFFPNTDTNNNNSENFHQDTKCDNTKPCCYNKLIWTSEENKIKLNGFEIKLKGLNWWGFETELYRLGTPNVGGCSL